MNLKIKLGPPLIAPFLELLKKSWKVEIIGGRYIKENREKNALLVPFWHEGILALAPVMTVFNPVTVLISKSPDGEIAARTVKRMGYAVIRGGSDTPSDAFAAARNLMACRKPGTIVAVAADGPKGPPLKFKKGFIKILQKSNYMVVPLVIWSSKALHFNSWDRTFLPLPRAKVVAVFGKPVFDYKKIEKIMLKLREKAMNLAKI